MNTNTDSLVDDTLEAWYADFGDGDLASGFEEACAMHRVSADGFVDMLAEAASVNCTTLAARAVGERVLADYYGSHEAFDAAVHNRKHFSYARARLMLADAVARSVRREIEVGRTHALRATAALARMYADSESAGDRARVLAAEAGLSGDVLRLDAEGQYEVRLSSEQGSVSVFADFAPGMHPVTVDEALALLVRAARPAVSASHPAMAEVQNSPAECCDMLVSLLEGLAVPALFSWEFERRFQR